jgi:hypothetical protein
MATFIKSCPDENSSPTKESRLKPQPETMSSPAATGEDWLVVA